jgi:hypothetical protein
MFRQSKVWGVLKNTTASQRSESYNWLLYSLAGSTLPIWLGGYVLLPVFRQHFNWLEYSQHGELALLSAALLAPTLRLIARDLEDSHFVKRQTFLFFGWIFVTASVALYSGVISANGMPDARDGVNKLFLFLLSLSLFVVSVLFSFLVTLIDNQRPQPKEVFAVQAAGRTRLSADFEKTGPLPPAMAAEPDTPDESQEDQEQQEHMDPHDPSNN